LTWTLFAVSRRLD